jgi:hypothetical protein
MVEIDFKKHPKKSAGELDKLYPPDLLLILEDIFATKHTFIVIFQDLIDIMKYGFEHEVIRKRPINFKFKKKDKNIVKMQLNHFISNLIFWRPLIDVDKVELLDESWIFDFSKFNANTLMDYINEKLLPEYDTDFASKNVMVDELYHNIISISHAFCLLMGMGVSLYDLHQLELRNPEVRSLMRDSVDQSLSPHEIEQELNARNKRLIQLLIEDPIGNDYKPFFASGTALKEAQFREYIVRIGFKADINGNTVPIFIDNNFLIHGLNKPSYIYLNALSGRKSLILSKLSMGGPGAFSRKLVYQAMTSTLREGYESCDSIATVDYHINDETFLKLLHGRYYYDARGEMKLLNYKKDKDLIGKVVRFRSPATCSSHDGVCKYCYGHLFEINKEMNSAGALAALKITEPIGQQVLSSKHNQTTSSNDLKFSEGYDDLFETNNSTIILKEDSDLDADLYLGLRDVQVEEMDDSEYYYVTSFDIVDENNKTVHHIQEDSGAKFYLNDTLINAYKQKSRAKNQYVVVSLEDMDEEDGLFTIEVKNKELTEPLKIFTKILNTNSHYGAQTVSEFCQIFAEKLISMNIKYELVHAEMIIRSLLRKKSNMMEFPDFSLSGNLNDYQILKLNDGQLYHPSALVSLPYGYIRRQLLSTDLYEKTATGPMDPLYVSRLSTYIN